MNIRPDSIFIRLRDYIQNRYNKKIEVGEFSYGTPRVIRNGGNNVVKIGKFCSISKNVTFLLLNNHRSDWISTYPFPVFRSIWKNAKGIKESNVYKGNIIVGNDVWIGYGVMIMAGVTIGDGAVIAANSLVVKDVPPYAIVGGNPAQLIRKRFSDKDIKELLKIRWWNWSKSEINKNLRIICSSNIGLLKKVSQE